MKKKGKIMKEKFVMADVTQEFDPEDIQKNKAMGILAYISLLVLVPIFGAKDSKFARFNANQGLVLLIGSAAFSLISNIFGGIKFIGWIFSLICGLGNIGIAVLAVFGIVNVARGFARKLPLIGEIKILK